MFGAFLSALITACTDDTFSGQNSVRTEGSARIRVTITIPDVEIVQTRAGGSGDAAIENLNILLFDNSHGDADETRIGLVAQRSVNASASSVNLPLSTGSRMVYVVANARGYLGDILTKNDGELMNTDGSYKYSLAQVRTMLTTALSVSPDGGGFINDADIPGMPVPMSAQVRFDSGLSSTDEINAQMIRMLSKISVSTSLDGSKFKIKSLTLCNGAQAGTVLAPTLITDDGKGLARIAYTASADSVLYAYPTAVGGTDVPVSVVVEAEYNGQAASSFYRLLISKDLSDPSKGLSLARNHHYLIKINRVDMDGSPDLTTAISASPANIDYNVEESNDFSNVTLVNGNLFSLDTERLIVYADSMEATPLAEFRTNYPFAAGEKAGSIVVDKGLTLQGNPFFTNKDTLRNFIVEISPSYNHVEHSDSSPKGIHLTLGGYTETIEIIKKHSADIHPVTIELKDITNAKFLSSSGDSNLWWTSFSLSPVYSPFSRLSGLSNDLLTKAGNKGYLLLDENLNVNYREAYFEITSIAGKQVKIIIRQEGIKRYQLGFFGGTLQVANGIYQYSNQVLVEGYEENEEKLALLLTVPSQTEKEELHDLLEDGRQSTIVLARKYKSPAALYCLNKNRDTNGNGIIDDDEVLWYLPGIRQGLGIELYQSLAGGINGTYYSSSCFFNPSKTGAEGVWVINTIADTTGYRVFATAYANSVSEKRFVRCVRNK